MDSAGFDVTRWEHWLVVGCAVAMAAVGLWSSWQFRQAAKRRLRPQQVRSRLARRLSMELGRPDVPGDGFSRSWPQPTARPQSTVLSQEMAATQSMGRRHRAGK